MAIKKKREISPETKQTLHELEDIVHRLGYTMRYEKGNFTGGYCLVKESKLFVVNSRFEPEKRISVICKNLKEMGIDGIFVKPGIREIIEGETDDPMSSEEGKPAKGDAETSSA